MRTYLLLLCLALISGKMLRFLEGGAAVADSVSGYKGFSKFKDGVNKICDMWDKICATFGSSQWNYVKGIIDQQGYEKLCLDSNFMSNGGVRFSSWDVYWKRTINVLKLDEQQRTDAEIEIEFAKDSDGNAWVANTIGFDNKQGGEIGKMRIINFLTNVRKEDNKFDAIVFDFEVSFKIAPRLVFRSKGCSILGGIYSDSEDYIEEQNVELTEAQVDAILKYFKLLSLELIASVAGVKLTLPFH